ncbi:MAG: hypothetical protein U0694_18210 [Anaerolineae bacterium]
MRRDANLLLIFETLIVLWIVTSYQTTFGIFHGIVITAALLGGASIWLLERTRTCTDYHWFQLVRNYPFGWLVGVILFAVLCWLFPEQAVGHVQYYVFVWFGVVLWRTVWVVGSLRRGRVLLATRLHGVYPIAAFSAFISVTVMVIFPAIAVTYDGIGYINYARAILGEQVELYDYISAPLLPLWMIVSGIFAFGSFGGYILLQAILAFLSPVLVYGILRTVARRAVAELGALLVIITLVPYAHNQSVLTKRCTFLILLAVYASALWYFVDGQIRYLCVRCGRTPVIYCANQRRKLIYVMFLAAFVLFRPRQWRHYLAAAAVIFAWVMASNAFLRATGWDAGSQSGRLMFYNMYLASAVNFETPPFAPENGSGTQEMMTITQTYLIEHPTIVPDLQASIALTQLPEEYATLYEPYTADPAELVAAIAARPTASYYMLLVTVLNDQLGVQSADQLLMRVALERLQRNPELIVTNTLRNLQAFFIGPTYFHNRMGEKIPLVYGFMFNVVTGEYSLSRIPAALAQDVINRQDPTTLERWAPLYHSLFDAWEPFFSKLRPAVFLLSLASVVVFVLNKQQRPVIFLCATVVAYSGFVVSTFAEPNYRYVYHTFALEIILAVLVVGMVFERVWKARQSAG